MTLVAPHPTQTLEVSRYPNYKQALAYLRNFLRHGQRAIIRTKRYAYYQHSSSLRVIVIRLAPVIFEVRAYPWNGLYVSTINEALRIPEFRGWLFARDYCTNRIYYITGSQRAGIERYNRVKRAIKQIRKLAMASRGYLSQPNRSRPAAEGIPDIHHVITR